MPTNFGRRLSDQPHILAIDLGTSGPKVALVSVAGHVVGGEFESVDLILLPDVGAEQDPDAWWAAVASAARHTAAASPQTHGSDGATRMEPERSAPPTAVHIALTLRHAEPGVAATFLADLAESVAEAGWTGNALQTGAAPMYGMAATFPHAVRSENCCVDTSTASTR